MKIVEPRTCCSDLEIDQLLLDELDEPRKSALTAHLASSSSCAARLAELRAGRDEWRATMPPLTSSAHNVVVLQPRSRSIARTSAIATFLAAAAAIAFVVSRPAPVDGERAKGSAVHAGFTVDGTEGIARDVVKRGANVAIFARANSDAWLIALVDVGGELRTVSNAHADAGRDVSLGQVGADASASITVVACPSRPPPDFALDFYTRDEARRAQLLDEAHCSIDRTAFSVEPR